MFSCCIEGVHMDLWISSLDFECAASPRFLSSLNRGRRSENLPFLVSFVLCFFRCWLVSPIGFRGLRNASGKLPDSVASCVRTVDDDMRSVGLSQSMSICHFRSLFALCKDRRLASPLSLPACTRNILRFDGIGARLSVPRCLHEASMPAQCAGMLVRVRFVFCLNRVAMRRFGCLG